MLALRITGQRIGRPFLDEAEPQRAEVRQPPAEFTAVVQHPAEEVPVRRHIRRYGEIRDGIAVERLGVSDGL